MRASLQGLQSSLRGHSRKALKAAMGLETCSANLSYTHKYVLLTSPGSLELNLRLCGDQAVLCQTDLTAISRWKKLHFQVPEVID